MDENHTDPTHPTKPRLQDYKPVYSREVGVVAESLLQLSTRTAKEGSGTSKRSKHTSSARFLTSFSISEEAITDAFLVTLVNPSATQRREA